MFFGNRVQSQTYEYIVPKVFDNVLTGNALALRTLGKAKEWKGERYSIPVKVTNSGQASSFAGLDSWTAQLVDTKVKMEYDMRALRMPVAVGLMEAVANQIADTQAIDLVVSTMEEAEQELADYLGTVLYGDGTGNSSKDPNGLGNLVDDGTTAGTVGNLSRTTYPVLNGTRTASGGTLTLAKLGTLYSAISDGSGRSNPTSIFSNETVRDLYESLLTPTVRENYSMNMGYYSLNSSEGMAVGNNQSQRAFEGHAGFQALSYKGMPWFKDPKATAQTVFMLNEHYLHWVGADPAKGGMGYKSVKLNSKTIDGEYAVPPLSQFAGFGWSGWQKVPGQAGAVGELIILGNLVTSQPRRQGRLTGVTSV